jgi:hypothetical protein
MIKSKIASGRPALDAVTAADRAHIGNLINLAMSALDEKRHCGQGHVSKQSRDPRKHGASPPDTLTIPEVSWLAVADAQRAFCTKRQYQGGYQSGHR